MVNTSIVAMLLASPPSSPPDFGDRLDHVELTHDGDDIQITGYDRDGLPIGVLAMWTDDRGAIHLESDFDDGYSSTVVLDGVDHTDATMPATVVAERAHRMADWLTASDSGPQEAVLHCALALAGSIAGCANGNALITTFACPTAVLTAWCTCTPLVTKKRPSPCPG